MFENLKFPTHGPEDPVNVPKIPLILIARMRDKENRSLYLHTLPLQYLRHQDVSREPVSSARAVYRVVASNTPDVLSPLHR